MTSHLMRIGKALRRRRVARRDEQILRGLSPHLLRDIGFDPDNLRNELRNR